MFIYDIIIFIKDIIWFFWFTAGIYVIRRRALIELLEECNKENRYNFVTDILIRYKNLRKIYGYMMDGYWSNIADVDSYYRANVDFLKRNYSMC